MCNTFIYLFIFVILHLSISQEITRRDYFSDKIKDAIDSMQENMSDSTAELSSALDLSDLEKNNTKVFDVFINRDGKKSKESNEEPTNKMPYTVHDLHGKLVNHTDHRVLNLNNSTHSDESIVLKSAISSEATSPNSGSWKTSREVKNEARSESDDSEEEFKDKQLGGVVPYPQRVPVYNQVDNYRDFGYNMPVPPMPAFHGLLLPQHQALLQRNILFNTQHGLHQNQVPSLIDPYANSNWGNLNPLISKYGISNKYGKGEPETRLIEDYHDISSNSYAYSGKTNDLEARESGPNVNVLQKLRDASNRPLQSSQTSLNDGSRQDSKNVFSQMFRYPHYSHSHNM